MPHFVTSDGVRLHYRDGGGDPPVVLVGGFSARASSWSLLEADLCAAGYRPITVDRRSHGDSDFPQHGQRLARHAADLEELRAHLLLDDALWVGSSMGASALLSFVDLFGCENLRGLVLVDQTPKMINDSTWDLGMYDLTWSSVDSFVSEFPGAARAFHAPPPDRVLDLLAADVSSPYPFDQTRGLLRDHTVQDWRDVIPRVNCPLLAIGGRHSPLWPVESTEWIAAHAPLGEAAVLEASGHLPHLSEPDLFSATLVSWIARAAE